MLSVERAGRRRTGLAGWAPSAWQERYGKRVDTYRLPDGQSARQSWLRQVGVDGYELLEQIHDETAPGWLRQIPAVQIMRESWVQQFYRQEGEVCVRQGKDLPPGRLRPASPYDPEARYGIKRQAGWIGYKAHLTETCEPDAPHLITHVVTTDATVEDSHLTAAIHDDLAARDLLPAEHAVDTGYVSAPHLVRARDRYGIDLLGPVQFSTSRQAHTGEGFGLEAFAVDFDRRHATCPAGHTSSRWREELNRGAPVIKIAFRKRDCGPCPLRPRCTTAAIGLR
ncbi:transposase, partial [Planomonospora parontospora]